MKKKLIAAIAVLSIVLVLAVALLIYLETTVTVAEPTDPTITTDETNVPLQSGAEDSTTENREGKTEPTEEHEDQGVTETPQTEPTEGQHTEPTEDPQTEPTEDQHTEPTQPQTTESDNTLPEAPVDSDDELVPEQTTDPAGSSGDDPNEYEAPEVEI